MWRPYPDMFATLRLPETSAPAVVAAPHMKLRRFITPLRTAALPPLTPSATDQDHCCSISGPIHFEVLQPKDFIAGELLRLRVPAELGFHLPADLHTITPAYRAMIDLDVCILGLPSIAQDDMSNRIGQQLDNELCTMDGPRRIFPLDRFRI